MASRLKILNIKFIYTAFLILLFSAISIRDVASGIPEDTLEEKYCSSMITKEEMEAPADKSDEEFCDTVNQKFRNYGWNSVRCNPKRWQVYEHSSKGNPLFYQEFGFNDNNNETPVNLILCGVHGDEPPSIYLCFQMTRHILFDNPDVLKNFRAVIAPIVNPDGFFANTRPNANGIDVNRNLPTQDWDELSLKIWTKYQKDPRKYPGSRGGSEIESQFQAYLIERYKPDKIISVHAPLGFLDFDGPGDQKYNNLVRIEERAKHLGINIEVNSNRFVKFVDYKFFPGSLGNYAGNERKIPTYTVELPTVNSAEAHNYWSTLKYALISALGFKVYDNNEVNPFYSVGHMFQQAFNKEYKSVDAEHDEMTYDTAAKQSNRRKQELSH